MTYSASNCRRIAVPILLVAAAALGGCNATAPKAAPPAPEQAGTFAAPAIQEPGPGFVPVLRQGRYTLVELAPSSAQRDLLRQLVQTDFPASRRVTVGDALGHVLARSGYRLCSSPELTSLQALPLPASHYRMGPMMLRDALLTLSGPGWDLTVDDLGRQVCFTRVAPLVASPINPNQAVNAGAAAPTPAVVRRPLP